MGDYFNLQYHNTTCKTEILAGISMFFSVAYILVVNPTILSTCGMDYYSVFMATVITSAISTFVMAIYAKMPIILAPGLSINSMFAWITLEYLGGDYRITLLATYFSGVFFMLLVLSGVFEKIDKKIPGTVKFGILAGVGLSLARVGLNSINFFKNPLSLNLLYTIIGITVMVLLIEKKVHGAVVIGMLASGVIGYTITALSGDQGFLTELKTLFDTGNTYVWDMEQFFDNCFKVPSFDFFINSPSNLFRLAVTTLILTIYHFADAVGTTSSLFAFMKAKGTELPEKYKKKAMYVNGVAGMTSGLLGTSSATSYAETIVGISEGAKTGIAGITVGILFLASGIFLPVAGNLLPFVTAPALIVVGGMSTRILLRLKNASLMEKLIATALTIYIGLTFQVAIGFVAGMLVYGIYRVVVKSSKE